MGKTVGQTPILTLRRVFLCIFNRLVVRAAGLEPAPQHFRGAGRLSISAENCGYDALLSEHYGEQVWRKTEASQGFCGGSHIGVKGDGAHSEIVTEYCGSLRVCVRESVLEDFVWRVCVQRGAVRGFGALSVSTK